MKSIAGFLSIAASKKALPIGDTWTALTRRSFVGAAGSMFAFALAALLLPVGQVSAQADGASSVQAGLGAQAKKKPPKEKWVASWSASTTAFGVGSPVAQPDLQFPLPTAATDGVVDQTIRMVVKPDLWSDTMRFRFSNVFGDRAVTFSRVTVALQSYAGNAQENTVTPVTFGGRASATIPKGEEVWSDAIDFKWVKDTDDFGVAGHNLLVSVAVLGKSGAISWHGKAVTTNYLTPQGSGDHTLDTDDAAYPYSSTSWYFLNAVDVMAASNTVVVCAFGD